MTKGHPLRTHGWRKQVLSAAGEESEDRAETFLQPHLENKLGLGTGIESIEPTVNNVALHKALNS